MSYILEALKKSEQERGAGNSPSVQTIHSAGLQYAQPKKPVWPYILAAVITLNVIALIVFFAPSGEPVDRRAAINTMPASPAPDQTMSSTPAVPAAKPAPPPQPAPNQSPPAQASIEPHIRIRQTDQPAPQAEAAPPASSHSMDNYQPAISMQTRNDYVSVVDVRDLPLDIQARIPDMVFSAHVYSSNPQQRSVVINGNFMEQGDMLTPHLRLDEITADGVVFDFDGARFRTSVLSNWKLN